MAKISARGCFEVERYTRRSVDGWGWIAVLRSDGTLLVRHVGPSGAGSGYRVEARGMTVDQARAWAERHGFSLAQGRR